MANEIINTENIAVEFAEQNVVLVDPNRIIVDGKIQERLVKHEELTIYHQYLVSQKMENECL